MEKKSMSFCQVPINQRMGSHSVCCQPERYINMHNNTQVMNRLPPINLDVYQHLHTSSTNQICPNFTQFICEEMANTWCKRHLSTIYPPFISGNQWWTVALAPRPPCLHQRHDGRADRGKTTQGGADQAEASTWEDWNTPICGQTLGISLGHWLISIYIRIYIYILYKYIVYIIYRYEMDV